MPVSTIRRLRAALLLSVSLAGLGLSAAAAVAQDASSKRMTEVAAPPGAGQDSSTTVADVVVTMTRATRSAVSLGGSEIQKILPGVNPLKAIQTLPGVVFETADPWGNNEQNISLFIHGFNGQQLGYTLDGLPLGDQNYANFNGLTPQRAVISENVSRVLLSSGAAELGTASTSNLGGAIQTFTSDPRPNLGAQIAQTFGSYDAYRTYARIDSGKVALPGLGDDNSAYISFIRQDAVAWDYPGHQGGYQVNAKAVHNDEKGKLTLYFDWSKKAEPNEDAVVHVAGETSAPYTRPFLYPDFNAALAYLGKNGATPAADGNNYRNYYGDAQREDYLAYIKYDYKVSDAIIWSNQAYFHNDTGQGQIAGPISAAGLPGLFAVYYPGQNLSQVFGGTNYALRTTEYQINRGGVVSNIDIQLGQHQIEGGIWYEHNFNAVRRRWYAYPSAKTPYEPADPLLRRFTQYGSNVNVDIIQPHIQDNWRITPDLTLQAGFKSSLQYADGVVVVQPKPGSLAGTSTALGQGEIDSTEAFLPTFGALYEVTANEELFANAQNNVRQFQTSIAAALSPFNLGSQQAFDQFKTSAKPETSWTYEGGVRSHRSLNLGILTAYELQASYYHVDFSNRLLAVSPTTVIASVVGGVSVLQNVGSVTTDGADLAGTLHFGPHFSFYDAISYNTSKYNDNYASGATTIKTAGKTVPDSPNWLNKFVASANYGPFEAQLVGDYVGRRYATYTNDLSVKSHFLVGLEGSYSLAGLSNYHLQNAKIAVNVTNLFDKKGVYELVVGAASGTYNSYPTPPRMVFLTLSAGF